MLGTLRASAVACLIALLSLWVYVWLRGADADADASYRKALRTFVLADTALDAAVLRARAGLELHYDTITRHKRARDAQLAALGDIPQHFDDDTREELEDTTKTLALRVKDGVTHIESFKRNNSVLRNSVSYLPELAAELSTRASDNDELTTELNGLITDVLLFYEVGGGKHAGDVTARMKKLEALEEKNLSVNERRMLKLVVRHADKMVEAKKEVDEAVDHLMVLPITGPSDALRRAYGDYYRGTIATAQQLRLSLFLLALLTVMLGAAYIILRLKRSAETLAEAKVELELALATQKELAELKNRFVSMTSHEFRTPLTVIASSAELLDAYEERWSSEKKHSHLGRIQKAAKSMKGMLEEVITIGKAQDGKLPFKPSKTNVERLCRDMVEDCELSADGEHDIAFELDGELTGVYADEALLTHIVSNLLSNAVKYSHAATTVHFDVRRVGDALELKVSDDGIGISEEDQKRLFDSFHRGTNVGNIKGTGLGLAIVDRAVAAHGGSIEVDSELDKGTTFVVKLPLGKASDEEDTGDRRRRSDSREHSRPS